MTALHFACEKGFIGVAELIVGAGGSPTSRNKVKLTYAVVYFLSNLF